MIKSQVGCFDSLQHIGLVETVLRAIFIIKVNYINSHIILIVYFKVKVITSKFVFPVRTPLSRGLHSGDNSLQRETIAHMVNGHRKEIIREN